MGGGGGPPAITFTINTLLANLTEQDRQSIEDSITEILQGLDSGNVTFSEFREGSAIVDASPQNFVSPEAVNEVINEPGNIKTLGTKRFIVAKIDEAPVEYTDKLIIVPTDDNEDILYINNEAADTVARTDWIDTIDLDAIKSVAFGSSVQTIGEGAFEGSRSLAEVTIPNSVQTLGRNAFAGCISIEEVTIPDSVQTIEGNAFASTSLTEVTIPDSVQTIEGGAFGVTSLTEVTIPKSVQTLGVRVFEGSQSLSRINVDLQNQNFSSLDGVLFNKLQTELLEYPIGNTRTQYTIPNSVETIEVTAFFQCTSLTEVTIPDSVQSIGRQAFGNCTSLTEVTIPDSVQTIEAGAFEVCTRLAEVTISDSVQTIGASAFEGCTTLAEVTIPDSVQTITLAAFRGCTSLTEVTIPDSVQTIGEGAFEGCTSLARVIFNSDITEVAIRVFDQCPAVSDPTDFVVPNARNQNISFEDRNGDFSDLGTAAGTLEFGGDDSGGAGFKTVTVA